MTSQKPVDVKQGATATFQEDQIILESMTLTPFELLQTALEWSRVAQEKGWQLVDPHGRRCSVGQFIQGTAPMIDSTSDERTVNNVMRHEYRVLTDEEKAQMQAIKDKGLEFHGLCEDIGAHGPSRELSLAKTKIEEAVMWAVKHITR